MDKDVPIVAFESEGTPDIPENHHMDLIELKLDIFGKLLHICIGAENKPVKLSDLIPLARFLSSKIISTTKRHITNNGDTIACRRNCSQCCRYLVPLAIPEAMRLTEEVTAMTQWERKFVDESSLLAARRILELTPKNFLEKLGSSVSETNSKDVSDWYRRMNLPCPFLVNNLCTIYEQRPIACREQLVIGSASDCKGEGATPAQPVKMPTSILEALAHLTSELEQTTIHTIMLPFAVFWCRENPEYFKHTWLASQLVRRFVNILTTKGRHKNKPIINTLPINNGHKNKLTPQNTDNSCRNQERASAPRGPK